MKIALCQMNIAFEDKSANLKKICSFIFDAKQKKADIIFFPEMTLTGFSMDIQKTMEKDFFCIDKIRKVTYENEIYVAFGWVKPSGEKAENHYSVIAPNGDFICDYVKIHPFSYAEEDKFFYGGNKIVYFNVNGIYFSCFICYDLRFPEVFRAVSEKVSVIIVAANWPLLRIEHWECLLKARSIENQCYIIGVNCFGVQKDIYYSGGSCIFNPNGQKIFFLENKECMKVFDFENKTNIYRKNFPILNDRKVELYKELIYR